MDGLNTKAIFPKQIVSNKSSRKTPPKHPPVSVDEGPPRPPPPNACFRTNPARLDFRVTRAGAPLRRTVSVVNIARAPQRCRVLQPRSAELEVEMKWKGLIAPGMNESISVTLTPSSLNSFNDRLEIHTAEGVLTVPIRVYPGAVGETAAKSVFPRKIDLGNCAVGDVRKKTVYFETHGDADFDFELSITRPHIDFKVHPMIGSIPAHSRVPVTVTYTPSTRTTAILTLRVSISQVGFTSFIREVVGSAVAKPDRSQRSPSSATAPVSQALPGSVINLARTISAVGVREANRPRVQKKKKKKNAVVCDVLGEEDEQDGIILPRSIHAQCDVNYILTQKPGAEKLRRMKKEVRAQNRQKRLSSGVSASEQRKRASFVDPTVIEENFSQSP
eukprot:27349_1